MSKSINYKRYYFLFVNDEEQLKHSFIDIFLNIYGLTGKV